ncbi:PAS domain S-box [Oceanococcus atlanticus]|uniref:histidine kinase n=1 Tax=Oceanococcus atlanticus TaxID=1317117 RepID=A0A1Y1SH86_9GAMM|nr:ATP-binding protein [Oceanococcus atlanticus]ORE88948.1 PAS domain S-box [Oceanococcus atlanticus]
MGDDARETELLAQIQALRDQLAAEKLAAESQRQEMEQFAFVASHDLKEPLRIVANYLGLLRRRYGAQLDDAAHDYLSTALDATVRMRQLIDNLLEFSRAQALDAEVQSLRPAVDRALQNLAQLIADNDAEIEVGPLPQAQIDAMQMARVFQNLIANALKYRSDQRPLVKISAQREAGLWRIRVEDNGMGIAPEHQQRIFQMFSRLHARDEIEGTGIGLATCQRIIERHGGTIDVQSSAGQGACFSFTLPAGQGDTAT